MPGVLSSALPPPQSLAPIPGSNPAPPPPPRTLTRPPPPKVSKAPPPPVQTAARSTAPAAKGSGNVWKSCLGVLVSVIIVIWVISKLIRLISAIGAIVPDENNKPSLSQSSSAAMTLPSSDATNTPSPTSPSAPAVMDLNSLPEQTDVPQKPMGHKIYQNEFRIDEILSPGRALAYSTDEDSHQVLLRGIPTNLVDDDKWRGNYFEDGIVQYTTTREAIATIHSYIVSTDQSTQSINNSATDLTSAPPTSTSSIPTPNQMYLDIYLKINEAKQLEKQGNYRDALNDFKDCYAGLAKIQKENPDWESELVTQRMEDCKAKITDLQPKAAAEPDTPPL